MSKGRYNPAEDPIMIQFRQARSVPIHSVIEDYLQNKPLGLEQLRIRMHSLNNDEKLAIETWFDELDEEASSGAYIVITAYYLLQKNNTKVEAYFNKCAKKQSINSFLDVLSCIVFERVSDDFIDHGEDSIADVMMRDAVNEGNLLAIVTAAQGGVLTAEEIAFYKPSIPRFLANTNYAMRAILALAVSDFDGELITQIFQQTVYDFTISNLQQMAAQNVSFALMTLAGMYESGNGARIPKDITLAFGYYQRAAAQGELGALHAIAIFYRDGLLGRPRDNVRAFAYLHEAAQHDYAESLYLLGDGYQFGSMGLVRNADKAIYYYRLADESGVRLKMLAHPAMKIAKGDPFNPAYVYHISMMKRGKFRGFDFPYIAVNNPEIFDDLMGNDSWSTVESLFKRKKLAITILNDYQHRLTQKQYLVDSCLLFPPGIIGVISSYFARQEYLQQIDVNAKSIDQLEVSKFIPYQLNRLETLYEKFGKKYIFSHLFQAISRGSVSAKTKLGNIYLETKDYESAYLYFKEAADHGNPGALYGLGELFFMGYGREKDPAKSASYFYKALEKSKMQNNENLPGSKTVEKESIRKLRHLFEEHPQNLRVVYYAFKALKNNWMRQELNRLVVQNPTEFQKLREEEPLRQIKSTLDRETIVSVAKKSRSNFSCFFKAASDPIMLEDSEHSENLRERNVAYIGYLTLL